MLNIKHIRRSRIKAGVMASILGTVLLCFSSLAKEESASFSEGPTSNVWITAVEVQSEARISVTVPLSYGFVVVGSVEEDATGGISVEDNNLLLPNIKVAASTPSDASATEPIYYIQTISEPNIPIRNYSTDVREEDIELENPPREGLPVQLKPFIVEVTNEKKWQPWAETLTTAEADFRKFQMVLDGMPFSEKGIVILNKVKSDVIFMNGLLDLEAPPNVIDNGYNAAGTALIPSEKYLTVDVKVGGMQKQYNKIEKSVKVSEIHWQVIPGELPPQ